MSELRISCRLDVADGAVHCAREEAAVEVEQCSVCPFVGSIERGAGKALVVCSPPVPDLEIAAALNVAGGWARRIDG